MTEFQPVNDNGKHNSGANFYYHTEQDADLVRQQLAADDQDHVYKVVRTNREKDHPYEVYYRKSRPDRQTDGRLRLLRRKRDRMER